MSIGTDCSSVINRFNHAPTVNLFSTPMCQVFKEIREITLDLDIKLHLFKIKVHQDDMKDFSDLSFAKRENVACDLATKELIRSTGSEVHPFPSNMSSMTF